MSSHGASGPASTICQTVHELEKALDLSDPRWLQDDVHWWPLYRMELYRLLFLALASTPETPAHLPRPWPALRPVRTRFAHGKQSPVWLVSDGISFNHAGDLEFDRFCEPLRLACESQALATATIDRGSEAPRNCRPPLRWWTPLATRSKISGGLRARLRTDRRHEALAELLREAAADAPIPLPHLDAGRLDAKARAILALAGKVGRVMRAERPRAMFIVSYYDVSGFAYVLAAAREGIQSIDVQHGVTGRYHLAYSDWPTREGGWRLLPRWFWSWSDPDVELVRRWAGNDRAGAPHRAICGGNPFLQAWQDNLLAPDSQADDMLRSLLRDAGERTRVLVTMQPDLAHPEQMAPLIEAWKKCPEVMWWLRLHPMALHDRAALESMLETHGVRHAEIDLATALPLPLLLSHAHVHATHSSSTFIEARSLGLPSILWSRYGAELAEDAVADGSASIALDGSTLARSIATSSASRTIGGSRGNAPSMTQTLRTILDLPT